MDSLQQPGSSCAPLSSSTDENKCSKSHPDKPTSHNGKSLTSENPTSEDEDYDQVSITDTDLTCKLQVTGSVVPVYYQAISPEQIVKLMEDEIEQTRSVLPFPPESMRVLLNHYKWNRESLLDAFVESGDEDKLFHNVGIENSGEKQVTNLSLSGKDATSEEKECTICCSSKKPPEMYGMRCGHVSCTDCWNTYLKSQIMEEGMGSKITCIGHKCSTLLDDETVMKLTRDLDVRAKFSESIVNSFVQSNPKLTWCPSPGCTKAIKIKRVNEKDPQVKCDCGHVFCFKCGGDAHAPATCDLMERWNRKRRVEYESLVECKDLIALNVKQCPTCKGHVEKTGGCNIVTCKNSNCNTSFCWVCLQPWNTHNRSKCTHFEAQATMKKSQQQDRSDLQRFLFYITRFLAQEKSLKMEQNLYDCVKKDVCRPT